MMQQHRHWSLAIAFSIGMAIIPIGASAIDTADTRLLSTPAITEGKIAFVYADDIWVAGADGSNPRRLTSHAGEEQNPYFSPDGKHIAFTASYDGNVDVYVIPTEGGEPLAADLAPRRRHRPRLHARRQGAVQLATRGLLASRHASSSRSASRAACPSACRSRPPTRAPSRRTGNSWLTRRWARISASGRTIAAARPRGSGSSSSTTCRTRRSPSPPAAATTPSRCGSATRSISSRIATVSSTCTPTIGGRRRSRVAPTTTHSRSPAPRPGPAR